MKTNELRRQKLERELISWYFEPSQPQRIISALKTNFNLSPSYSAHKSPNHNFSQICKISPDTNICIQNTHTQTSNNIFEELDSSVMPLFKKKKKKHIRLGHAGIMDPSTDFSIPHVYKVFF